MSIFEIQVWILRQFFKGIHTRSCWYAASFLWREWTIIMGNSNLWWVSSQLARTSFCEFGSDWLHPGLILLPPALSSLQTLEKGPSLHNEPPVGREHNGSHWDASWVCHLYADGCVSHSVHQLPLKSQGNPLFTPQISFSGWGEKDNECLLDEAINL